MTAMVALVRGINVGGRSTLSMADLRIAAERCGHEAVRTYIQSGNLVFRSRIGDPAEVGAELAAAIAAAGDLSPAVMVRTADAWSALLAGNPFVGRAADLMHLHVVVLDGKPGDQLDALDGAEFLPEELALGDRHVYLLLPGGIGRSKLARAIARCAGDRGTVRNWRTVTRLAEMLAELG